MRIEGLVGGEQLRAAQWAIQPLMREPIATRSGSVTVT
jgi:hypothetical protein